MGAALATGETTRTGPLDVEAIRAQFPCLHQEIHGNPLVYLDSAASAQKPQVVLDAMTRLYSHDYANVHRGVHALSVRSTQALEDARETVRAFLNARETAEIVFTRGTTEGINLVAQTFGRVNVGPGDEVLITAMEHHSNIVPWQMLCEDKGAKLVVADIDDRGDLVVPDFERKLSDRTKLAAIVHVSNALGTVNPVERLIEAAHDRGVPVLVDGAQAAPHAPVDVQALDCDFFVFSGHKTYGPTGIGVLYAKRALLEEMPPWQGGGDMISRVTFEGSTWADVPAKFEAGTPHIAGAVGLAAALDFLTEAGLERVAAHEAEVLARGAALLDDIPGLRRIGTARRSAGVLSFVLDGVHPHDAGTILDNQGIAVRVGHHCAQPVMERFGVPATIRASVGVYNTTEEMDRLGAGIRKVLSFFG
ncbi:MAG: cysteine desulfurase [Myxococcota bacterium]